MGHPLCAKFTQLAQGDFTNWSTPDEGRNQHLEIQFLLLKLGSNLGLDIWVARNDRNKELDGQRISDLSGMKDKLPLLFDDATNRTIELIDVLWLKVFRPT